jgi:hypothetical protein
MHSYCVSGSATARNNCEVTSQAVSPSAPRCYYEANDAESLSARFNDIAGQVASCTYQLEQEPPDQERLFVYLDRNGTLERLERNVGWEFDGGLLTRVRFIGTACDEVQAGTAVPRVVYGCPDIGG